jgi:hypothetical protein
MSDRQDFRWLSSTGQLWKLRAEVWVGLLGMTGVFLGLLALLAAFFVGPTPLKVAGGFWAACILLKLGTLQLKYGHIRCPRCWHNPTRDQASGRRLPEDEMHERLASLEACPACGYSGEP